MLVLGVLALWAPENRAEPGGQTPAPGPLHSSEPAGTESAAVWFWGASGGAERLSQPPGGPAAAGKADGVVAPDAGVPWALGAMVSLLVPLPPAASVEAGGSVGGWAGRGGGLGAAQASGARPGGGQWLPQPSALRMRV